jgi:GH25 family lysozyme M1 (1,4-beta-N-acetylmuramidase)
VPKPRSKWTFWQYTQAGTTSAIAGSVDRNHFDGTRDDLNALGFASPQILAPGQQATA